MEVGVQVDGLWKTVEGVLVNVKRERLSREVCLYDDYDYEYLYPGTKHGKFRAKVVSGDAFRFSDLFHKGSGTERRRAKPIRLESVMPENDYYLWVISITGRRPNVGYECEGYVYQSPWDRVDMG